MSLFSKATGLQLNMKKCEILTIHDHPLVMVHDIPVKSQVKYLGITVTKNKNIRITSNVANNIQKCKTILNSWLQRDLSIFGRVLLTKMESLSRLIYPAYSLEIPDKLIKEINHNNFNFIWKNRHHYIRRGDIVKSIEEGGLNVIDFDPMNGTIKLKWLQNFVKKCESFWFDLPSKIFQKVGGIDLLLRCDFDIPKLPVKLSSFHQQVLRYWKLIFKHNFTPHTTPLWNNRYIVIKRKSFYYEDWMERGIWSILHLLDSRGNFLSLDAFTVKYNLIFTNKKYTAVINAIPRATLQLIQGMLTYSRIIPQIPSLMINDCSFLDKKCNNKILRNGFTATYFSSSLRRSFLFKEFSKEAVVKIRTSYISFPVLPKAKEVHFKMLNDIYPCNDLLYRRFNIGVNVCTFCNADVETLEHLFFSCNLVKTFWEDWQMWLNSNAHFNLSITYRDILFGLQLEDKKKEFGSNNLIILAKFFIHKCRFQKISPIFPMYLNEMKLFKKYVYCCKSLKALTLYDFLAVLIMD